MGDGGKGAGLYADLSVGKPYDPGLLSDEVPVGKLIEAGRPITLKVRVVLITVSNSEEEVEDVVDVSECNVEEPIDVNGEIDVDEKTDVGDEVEVGERVDVDEEFEVGEGFDFIEDASAGGEEVDTDEDFVVLSAGAVTVMNDVRVVITSGIEAVFSSEE